MPHPQLDNLVRSGELKAEPGDASEVDGLIGSAKRRLFDLSAKNPNGGEEVTHRGSAAILAEIAALDGESAGVLRRIKELQ
jgi:hypothetical protein